MDAGQTRDMKPPSIKRVGGPMTLVMCGNRAAVRKDEGLSKKEPQSFPPFFIVLGKFMLTKDETPISKFIPANKGSSFSRNLFI